MMRRREASGGCEECLLAEGRSRPNLAVGTLNDAEEDKDLRSKR
jgi:hypothetical protein